MTTAEAATRLGVNQSRVRQFIREGRLASEKVGRDRLIHEDALTAFIEAQKEKRPGPRSRAALAARVAELEGRDGAE
jgi:excisionase family DNA binding protein